MLEKDQISYAHHAVVRLEDEGSVVVTDLFKDEEKAWQEANQRQFFALERGLNTTYTVEEIPFGKIYFRRRVDQGGSHDTVERHGYTDGTHGSRVR